MALQAPIAKFGLTSNNGYYRLSHLVWDISEPNTVRIKLLGYANQSAFQAGEEPLQGLWHTIEIEPSNPEDAKVQIMVQIRRLGYLEIKSIPFFEGALDV